MTKTTFLLATFALALVAVFTLTGSHAEADAASTPNVPSPTSANAMVDGVPSSDTPHTLGASTGSSTLIVQVRRTNGNSIGTNGDVTLTYRCPPGYVCPQVVWTSRTNSKGRAIFKSMHAGTYDVYARNVNTGRSAKGVMSVSAGGRTWLHLRVQ